MRTLLFILALVAAPAVHAQSSQCAGVPEAYRAQCESAVAQKGAMEAAGKDKAAAARKAEGACQGLSGDAYKTCMYQNMPSQSVQADCSKLPPEKRAACERGKPMSDAAREACKSKYEVGNTKPFEDCMRVEIAKRRGG